MNQLNDKQQRILKIAIGIGTLIFLFWFVRSSGLVFEFMRPKAEAGALGSPAVAGALVLVAELLAVLGGFVLVMFSGAWKLIAGSIAPLLADAQLPVQERGLSGPEFVQAVLTANEVMPPERRAQLEQALIITAEQRDYKTLIAVAEKLAGGAFFPRQKGTVAEAPSNE